MKRNPIQWGTEIKSYRAEIKRDPPLLGHGGLQIFLTILLRVFINKSKFENSDILRVPNLKKKTSTRIICSMGRTIYQYEIKRSCIIFEKFEKYITLPIVKNTLKSLLINNFGKKLLQIRLFSKSVILKSQKIYTFLNLFIAGAYH